MTVQAVGIAYGPAPLGRQTTFSGRRAIQAARLAGDLRMGPFKVEEPIVTVPADAGGPARALVGMGLLGNYHATIDFPRRRLYLEGEGPLLVDSITSLGFEMEPGEDSTRIAWIHAEGGADEAGLRVGDEVLSIAGIDAEGFDRGDVSRALQGSGAFEVVIRREGQARTLQVAPTIVIPVTGNE